jgi:hypothetical protein
MTAGLKIMVVDRRTHRNQRYRNAAEKMDSNCTNCKIYKNPGQPPYFKLHVLLGTAKVHDAAQ